MEHDAKIAVVGCGYWGTNHARTLSELGALTAVSDLSAENAGKLAQQFKVPVKSLDDILSDKNINGLIFALPPHFHAQNAIRALNAGKNVLIEKPIALNSADAESVVAAAQASGKIAMTGHILRYHSAFEKMLSMFRAGELGELRYIHSHRVGLGKFHRKNDALWDIAPHDLSLILAITEQAPIHIHGEGAATINHLSDFAHLHLSFPSGVKAHVLTSRLNPYRERRLTIIGSKAMMSFDDALPWDQKLALYEHKLWEDELGWQSEMVEPKYIAVNQSMPLTAELQDFINAIQTGQKPRVSVEDGLEIVRILEAGTVKHPL